MADGSSSHRLSKSHQLELPTRLVHTAFSYMPLCWGVKFAICIIDKTDGWRRGLSETSESGKVLSMLISDLWRMSACHSYCRGPASSAPWLPVSCHIIQIWAIMGHYFRSTCARQRARSRTSASCAPGVHKFLGQLPHVITSRESVPYHWADFFFYLFSLDLAEKVGVRAKEKLN